MIYHDKRPQENRQRYPTPGAVRVACCARGGHKPVGAGVYQAGAEKLSLAFGEPPGGYAGVAPGTGILQAAENALSTRNIM